MSPKHHIVNSPLTGTVWKITTQVDSEVGEEETVVILESMKMEVPVEAGHHGKVVEILVKEGQPVQESMPMLKIEKR